MTITLDIDLTARLRVVADELGAHGLPLPVIVAALLAERLADLEARRQPGACFRRPRK